jgi:hypothetical protein
MGLGSGIRKKPIPDPGVKKAPDPGSRIRNTASWLSCLYESWPATVVKNQRSLAVMQ